MLFFELRALESAAVQVDAVLPANDPVWLDADPRPEGGVGVEGRLAVAGADRFYLNGAVSGTVQLACRRCLAEVTVDVREDANFLFAPSGDPATEDDPDVMMYDAEGRHLDIRPAVREQWLLAMPRFVQCSPECKGLCPQCGIDLNVETCSCASATTDNRWDALRQLARDASQA